MVKQHCLNLFGLPAEYSADQLKSRYRELLKQYHPDGTAELPLQQKRLLTVLVNQGYRLLAGGAEQLTNRKQTIRQLEQDTDYSCYRRGIEALQQAVNRSYSSKSFDLGDGRLRWDSPWMHDRDALQLFETGVAKLVDAELLFSRVLEQWPDSIWCADACERLQKVGRFYRLYLQILNNREQETEDGSRM